MILEALNELYDRLATDDDYEIAPPGYSVQKITFAVVLKPDGTLLAIQDERRHGDGRPRPRRLIVPGSTKPSGSGINPCFLWDNSGYMLGFKLDDSKPERTRATFESFRKRHLAVESELSAPAFSSVCRFLERWDPSQAESHPILSDAAATGFGVFRIHGISHYVHQDPAVRRWWQSHDRPSDTPEGECLVTGEFAPIARTHDKIRGVNGAQTSGATIAGFNAPAYESYGKKQSFNAPVSEEVAFRYVSALNALLDGPRRDRHRVVLGDTTAVFWTEKPSPVEDIFLPFAAEGSDLEHKEDSQDEGQRKRVQTFLQMLRRGGSVHYAIEPEVDGTAYHIVGLSPNNARIAIRFHFFGTLGHLLDNLRRHHQDIGLSPSPQRGRYRGDPEFPGARLLLQQAAREPKDVPPLIEGPLMRAIIEGTRYPHALFAAVIRRMRADRRVTYLRCCVLKGYLTRNLKEKMAMVLDPDRPDSAYRLGRLFAALEKTQKDALGDSLNTTIRDSFYSSASATPGSVFPRLLRTYQHHLAKLDTGARIARERLVQEIVDALTTVPANLTLAQQGIFALGYYQQTRDFYRRREATAMPETTEEAVR